jgi:two-component system osmolarity sensor histidine kinase EnvZ
VRELTETEGLRIVPADPADVVEAMPPTPFNTLLIEEIRRNMGERTQLARSVNGVPGIWASFPIDTADDSDTYWVALPETRIDPGIARHWLTWGLIALALALFVAWLIASRIARPLRALASAATQVGRGRIPEALPESGPDEMTRVAAAFNRMAHDLQQLEAERAEVLAGISHDLRTPIARLRLEAEMSVPDETAQNAIIGDLEQMEAIIGQFLDYARGLEGESESDFEAADLITVATGRARSPLNEVRIDCGTALPLRGRRTALQRALDNLLDNARKYAPGPLEIAAFREGERCIIEIRDRGPGIPAAESERLKRPFTRLERARSNVTGTGLGMAIIDRVVRGHGGSFDLLPRPGGGLIARISLPLQLL